MGLPGDDVNNNNSPSSSALSGVVLAGLRTQEQPVAMAGAILWATKFNGKLKGAMQPMGPIGYRFVYAVTPVVGGEY